MPSAGELAGREGAMLNLELDCVRPLSGVSSIIVSSSLISSTLVGSGSSGTGMCLFCSISNIRRERLSISIPTSPRTTLHSSSHSMANSTCAFTDVSCALTPAQFFSVVSICTTMLFNSSGPTLAISFRNCTSSIALT